MILPCRELILATGNPDKARELTGLLGSTGITLRTLAEFPDVRAVEETGTSLVENARRKAVGYARQLQSWVLADDTGLEVDALGGAPGVRSARFAGDAATMAENRALLLQKLEVHSEPWTACFVCRLAVADPGGAIVLESEGRCPGRILRTPSGNKGFGYDVLFEVDGLGRRVAELDEAETAEWGHRGRAVRAMKTELARIVPPDSGTSGH
jgi:XTP/dITP diphosphohydrolase